MNPVWNNMTHVQQQQFLQQIGLADLPEPSQLDEAQFNILVGIVGVETAETIYGGRWVYNLSNPDLPPPDAGASGLEDIIGSLNGFNMVELLTILHQTANELRKAGREARRADAESAQQAALDSAQKIRDAALTNMIIGVVMGGVNVIGGIVSIASASIQLKSLKTPGAEMKSAKLEMDAAKTNQALNQSQVKLEQTQQKLETTTKQLGEVDSQLKVNQEKIEADQIKLKQNQGEIQNAQNRVDQLNRLQDMDGVELSSSELKDLGDAKATVEKLEAENLNLEKDITDLKQANLDLEQKKTSLGNDKIALEQDVKNLKAEVEANAVKAEKANKAQIDALDKEFKAKNAEVEKLKVKSDKAPNDAKAKADHISAQKDLGVIEQRLNAAKAENYKNPTSVDALKNASSMESIVKVNSAAEDATARFQTASSKFNNAITEAQLRGQRIQGGMNMLEGAAKMTESGAKMISAGQEAEGAELTALSHAYQAKQEEDSEFAKQADELIRNAMDTLKAYLESQSRTASAIYRNM